MIEQGTGNQRMIRNYYLSMESDSYDCQSWRFLTLHLIISSKHISKMIFLIFKDFLENLDKRLGFINI